LDFEWVGVNKCFHGMCSELGRGVNGLAQAVDPLFDVSAGADKGRCHDNVLMAVCTVSKLKGG
jgi:hypothetical protein